MCGIAGLWAPDLPEGTRAQLVRAMVARLTHRGPDGRALWSDGEITLGLARLAIVDPSSPASVFANEDGRVRAVVNGEIYNHRDLARRLVSAGHRVPSGPDTAVIAHAYEQHGADFPRHLDGMFALALWDADRRLLLLARDRAGEKPLFVASQAGRLAFASEPAALLALPWVEARPDPAAVLRYLVHGFFAAPDCAFEGLRQVPPGALIECDARGQRSRPYWRPWDGLPAASARRSTESLVRGTRHELERSVAMRIPDERPFGVFLSGGLDSSLIASVAARCSAGFPTFSLALAGHGYDESAYARAVAARLGTEHHEVAMDDESAREALEGLSGGMDQPLGDPSLIPTWYLARFASRHVPVILTGEGGDELFAGYPTYLGHRYARVAERLPRPLTDAILGVARRARPADRHLSLAFFVERFLETRGLDPFDRHLSWFGNLAPEEAHGLLHPALAERVPLEAARAHLASLRGELDHAGLRDRPSRPDLLAYQIFDFVLTLGGGLLTKVDRSTMAHSVESRAPFLGAEMISWALGLPEDAKLRGASGKWVLKQVAKDWLPPQVVTRRKQGFSPPFSAWARGPWRSLVRDALSPERIERAGVLHPARVTALVEGHIRNEHESGRALWSLLSLQRWAERWVHGSAREVARPENGSALAAEAVATSAALEPQ